MLPKVIRKNLWASWNMQWVMRDTVGNQCRKSTLRAHSARWRRFRIMKFCTHMYLNPLYNICEFSDYDSRKNKTFNTTDWIFFGRLKRFYKKIFVARPKILSGHTSFSRSWVVACNTVCHSHVSQETKKLLLWTTVACDGIWPRAMP
jgi:hypothetical protein